ISTTLDSSSPEASGLARLQNHLNRWFFYFNNFRSKFSRSFGIGEATKPSSSDGFFISITLDPSSPEASGLARLQNHLNRWFFYFKELFPAFRCNIF
ncbi:hypothetical protein, partial [Flavobacterium sp.]|uniref:hypothetical protein n=1 Tax=Flavobacterium sp. TaxID=239 RepID=UPI00261E6C89